jgi:hypothetical protein
MVLAFSSKKSKSRKACLPQAGRQGAKEGSKYADFIRSE